MSGPFATAFGIGVALCIVPGAVGAEALRRALDRGFWSAVRLELGTLVGDAAWAALALAGVAAILDRPAVQRVLSVLGVVVLLRLAWSALRQARHATAPAPLSPAVRDDLASGVLISLVNPSTPPFWLGMGGTAAAATRSRTDLAVFFAGYMTACTLWCFFFPAVVVLGGRGGGPRLVQGANVVCALTLAYFAARLLMRALATS